MKTHACGTVRGTSIRQEPDFDTYKHYGKAHRNLLMPQDSFGEFKKKNHSCSSESVGNHQKTPSDLPAIVLNDIL